MEDIINRGGGNVLITVYNSTEDGQFADTDVTVNCDGREFTVKAGTQIRLTPGESITVYPYMYHDFHVEEGTGAVLLGEVSMCNEHFFSEDSRKLKRTSLHTAFFVMNIRKQNKKNQRTL